jgi:hypothetical protein
VTLKKGYEGSRCVGYGKFALGGDGGHDIRLAHGIGRLQQALSASVLHSYSCIIISLYLVEWHQSFSQLQCRVKDSSLVRINVPLFFNRSHAGMPNFLCLIPS